MQCFTCSDLTSADEGRDMQIWRWGAQIDDEKVDQRRWGEARNQKKDKGKKKGNSWEANTRKRWGKDRSTAVFCYLDEKSLPLISRSGLLSRSLPPPTGIIKTERKKDQRTMNRTVTEGVGNLKKVFRNVEHEILLIT